MRGFFFTFFLFSLAYQGLQAEDFLRKGDIHQIMEQILKQQGKTEVPTTILQKAYFNYLEQFDPDKIYLLQKEMESTAHLSERDLQAMIQEAKLGKYEEFNKLQELIKKAILRARVIREKVYLKGTKLVENNRVMSADKRSFSDYAKNVEELEQRIFKEIEGVIAAQGNGGKNIKKEQNLAALLKAFEQKKRTFENSYLELDEQDKPLSLEEKENFFSLHVLKAFAKSLDAHTSFYDSQEAYDMKVRLEKESQGLGIVVAPSGKGTLIVQKVISGGPAQKTGLIQVNDELIEVNGYPVKGTQKEKIIEILRGSQLGSEIQLKVRREVLGEGNKLIQVSLITEKTPLKEGRVDAFTYQTKEGLVGRVALHSFYQGDEGVSSELDLKEAIEKLASNQPLKGLILDLRDNNGGFLMQAVKVAGLFISNGVIVISKYFNGQKHVYRDVDSEVVFSGPLIVLISKATASAAEIVSQALQDYGVALVVGDERSYGKGTIQSQTVTGNRQSSYFKVTVGKYYTPSGKTPQLEGVQADIVVPGKYEYEKIGEEYLDHPLAQDQIAASYQDTLSDVDPSLKDWYLRYYMPSLQKPVRKWDSFLPILRRNSQKRIADNQEYQKLLEAERRQTASVAADGKKLDELQLQETVKIMEDLLSLKEKS